MTEYYEPIEIGGKPYATVFSANAEHLLIGGDEDVRVWRVRDRTKVATIETGMVVVCLAVSNDGRWIAGGTYDGGALFIWDATSHERILKHREHNDSINGVDFSPDSARLVAAVANAGTALVWDVEGLKHIQTLRHQNHVVAAKYSPHGDRIATGTHRGPIRVWDSTDGSLLVEIHETIVPYHNTGLVWSGKYLFAVTDGKIKQLDASSGSTVSEWPVHATNGHSCVALPRHGECIAYASKPTVTVWATKTHTQLVQLQYFQDIRVLALSPDGRFIALGGYDFGSGRGGNVFMSRIINSNPLTCLHPTLQEPDLQIDDAALHSWQHGNLDKAEASLTTAIASSPNANHHLLACRALVRARLQQWSTALSDANMAIDSEPSALGYIAKSIAYVGKGERHEAYRSCDIALERFHSSHITFLLLIKAIIVFMAEEDIDAISRMDDLIATVQHNSILYVVQACMHLLVGNSHMGRGNWEGAIQSFERARAQLRPHSSQTLSVISLISGWKFDNLGITIQQRLCETLYSAGLMNDAGKSLLELIHTFEEEVYMHPAIVEWVSDFARQCLSTSENDGDAVPNMTQGANSAILHADPTPLLMVWTKATLGSHSWKDALTVTAAFTAPKFDVYRAMCESLEAAGQVTEAIDCFYEMTSDLGDELYANNSIVQWVCDFTQRCLSALANSGDTVSNKARATDPTNLGSTPTSLLRAWAKAKLTHGSWEDTILSTASFTLFRAAIYWIICERLEATGRIKDAVKCFHRMMIELGGEINLHREHRKWAFDFRQRYSRAPKNPEEHLGDTAADDNRYNEAISHYTTALALDPFSPEDILIKRSKAHVATGSWQQALCDANQAIALDLSSPWGYEMKYAALHEAGDYGNAINAFEAMLSKIEQSPDPEIRWKGDRYISPSITRATIRKLIHKTTRHLPRELINTTDGRMYNRADLASAFESSPAFTELVSSMTTRIDYVRVKREIRQYYRYVMLSHKWEDNEPLFQEVMSTSVYALDDSPTHDKLQMFCRTVRGAGFNWAWSDTCCINKSDHFILQEALVAMFKWYEGSALTIVYLRGVHSLSQLGALMKSVWNTRAWTLQEYIAAKVVLFYMENWTLYLDLRLPNHKESPEIISEMEEATGVSAEELKTLRPGLNSIREKLRLASIRKTTLPEDVAYSLLGIFSATGISAIYGEGESTLGRLLANILTRSGDVGLLAWTGESGSFNSCLPARITVFNGPALSHFPPPIPDSEMEMIIAASQTSSFDLDAALRLYDRMCELATSRFAESRLTLPCIAVRLPRVSSHRTSSGRVHRVDTDAFGTVEIRTKYDLNRLGTLYLVHPWLGALLEHEDMHNGAPEDDGAPTRSANAEDELSDEEMDDGETLDDNIAWDASASLDARPESPPSSAPIDTAPMDRETRARRLVARLRQPFGALLFRLKTVDGRVVGHRRIAADSAIQVRFREAFSLGDILDRVGTIDVL